MSKNFQLRNGRMENHCAIHDLYVDGIIVPKFQGKSYTKIYNHVLEIINDEDFYSEPDAVPYWKGETGLVLKQQELIMREKQQLSLTTNFI